MKAAGAKKELLNNRIEISELQTTLGLDDHEADQNRKIIERVKLVQQKQELEKQLAELHNVQTLQKAKLSNKVGETEIAGTKAPTEPTGTSYSRFTETTFEAMALRGTNGKFEIKLYESAENTAPVPIKQTVLNVDDGLDELSTLRDYVSPLRIFRTYRFSLGLSMVNLSNDTGSKNILVEKCLGRKMVGSKNSWVEK